MDELVYNKILRDLARSCVIEAKERNVNLIEYVHETVQGTEWVINTKNHIPILQVATNKVHFHTGSACEGMAAVCEMLIMDLQPFLKEETDMQGGE